MNLSVQRMERLSKCPAWRFPFTAVEMIQWLGKGLEIPKEGWTAQTFARDGAELIVAITRLAKLTQKKAVPHVAMGVSRVLNKQMEMVIDRATTRLRKDFRLDESIWLQAIDEVLRETAVDISIEVVPPVQSVMSQAYSKTSTILAQKPNPQINARLTQEAREVATRISNVNETTRKRIENVIVDSLKDGATVTETAQNLRAELPEINANRSLMIARTELSNAWTRGAAAVYIESSTITHVSVIGCEAREDKSPQWHGESTCNYPNVPITDLPAFLEVGFHPNHTGTIVPSRFR